MSGPPVSLTVNGERRSVDAPDPERLLDLLRWRLGLLGTKEGCRTGDCGACTVLVDGRPTLSCQILAKEAEGAEVVTVEGIHRIPAGRTAQACFESETGLQCGYCTPGFVVALTGLLLETPTPRSPEVLWEELQGNLCRCTGYASIRRAVERAAREAP
jgi:carbon-monoxide dehydrogenase small subunit